MVSWLAITPSYRSPRLGCMTLPPSDGDTSNISGTSEPNISEVTLMAGTEKGARVLNLTLTAKLLT